MMSISTINKAACVPATAQKKVEEGFRPLPSRGLGPRDIVLLNRIKINKLYRIDFIGVYGSVPKAATSQTYDIVQKEGDFWC